MDIEIDPLSSTPIYIQIRDRVIEAIGRGELHRGDPLSSVRQLAGRFGINPATVAKAYDQLKAEGFIATNAKTGTFIASDRDVNRPVVGYPDNLSARMFTLIAEGRAHGLTPDELMDICEALIASLNGLDA